MEQKKNTPPNGVIIAIAAIVLMIILYFIFGAVFPDLFEGMNTGDVKPVTPN